MLIHSEVVTAFCRQQRDLLIKFGDRLIFGVKMPHHFINDLFLISSQFKQLLGAGNMHLQLLLEVASLFGTVRAFDFIFRTLFSVLFNLVPEQIRTTAERAAPFNLFTFQSQMLHNRLICHWNVAKVAAC